ncbi:MAG: DUF4124 domain-containing protein [Thermomonas sp.]
MRPLVLATCLLAIVAAGAQAQSHDVYKWKDAKGVTHYSDMPPPSGKYGSVEANASARVAAPEHAEVVDPRCTTARTNIDRLKSGDANIGLDADHDGKADAPLPEAQRADQLRLAEASARNFCQPAGA